jgi:hypothetical protein
MMKVGLRDGVVQCPKAHRCRLLKEDGRKAYSKRGFADRWGFWQEAVIKMSLNEKPLRGALDKHFGWYGNVRWGHAASVITEIVNGPITRG